MQILASTWHRPIVDWWWFDNWRWRVDWSISMLCFCLCNEPYTSTWKYHHSTPHSPFGVRSSDCTQINVFNVNKQNAALIPPSHVLDDICRCRHRVEIGLRVLSIRPRQLCTASDASDVNRLFFGKHLLSRLQHRYEWLDARVQNVHWQEPVYPTNVRK